MDEKQLFLSLQNGSDVRGTALASPGGAAVNLTENTVNRIAGSFVMWLAKHTGKNPADLKIGLGHDSRLTAAPLAKAAINGMAARGARVFYCGLASTPAMFMGTQFPETSFDGSIMLTASHLPKDRNGMKFFTAKAGLDKSDITEILENAPQLAYAENVSSVENSPLMELYAKSLRDQIINGVNLGEKPLEGLRIAVDAGNGGGGFFVKNVLLPFGADTAGSQFLEPDGEFPNHQPNPENKEAMESIRRATLQANADLGIIFDTDVDRMSAVLPDGGEVSRNAIIAMMAAILAPEYPGSTIVTDSITSDYLTEFLEGNLGLRHHRFKRGYKNVINEAVRLNGEGVITPLAIETSGHGALLENYFLDDGAYMAVRLIIAAANAAKKGEKLSALIRDLKTAPYECELRMTIKCDGFQEYGMRVLKEFEEKAREEGLTVAESYEGVRLSFQDGWAMLRMSLHDPIMPFNAESGTRDGLLQILSQAGGLLTGYCELDTSPIDSIQKKGE